MGPQVVVFRHLLPTIRPWRRWRPLKSGPRHFRGVPWGQTWSRAGPSGPAFRPSIHRSIHQSIHPSTPPSIPPSIEPSFRPSLRPSLRLSILLSIHPSLLISSGPMVGHQWHKQDITRPTEKYPTMFMCHHFHPIVMSITSSVYRKGCSPSSKLQSIWPNQIVQNT